MNRQANSAHKLPPRLGPPPTRHILKPHHLQLIKLLSLLFVKYGEHDLPAPFQLTLYRVLLSEISEVRLPASYQQLLSAIEEGSKATTPEAQKLLQEFKDTHASVQSPAHIASFFSDVGDLVPGREDAEDDTLPFERRSLFGYFTRRCYTSYMKLSFDAINQLYIDYRAWIAGNALAEAANLKKSQLDNSYNIFKTSADKAEYAQADVYALFDREQATGDYMSAAEQLRRYFEQHFHEGGNSGLHSHALLQLARLHYSRHEYTACRSLLREAISIARSDNDKITLQHAIGLLNRLQPVEPWRKALIHDIQPDLHPHEVLHDVKKLMRVNNQQPLAASFDKIAQAMTLYDNYTDFQRMIQVESEQWAIHAVQSVAWGMNGCTQLAEVEENVVIAFTNACSADNNRLTAIVNRAYHHARQGKYQEAISMLLQPEVFSGLTMTDYNTWAFEIWHILVLRASRREQERMYNDFLKPKRPPGDYESVEYWFASDNKPLGSMIRDPLYEVLAMKEVNQAHNSVEPLLKALWHTEFQQRYGLYRTAVVLLADIGLEYGMTKWSRQHVEEIIPQVINGDDLEQRAYTCFTLARCIIAAEDSTPEALKECLTYLNIAETDYRTLEIYRSLQDTQFLLSVVYHNLGMVSERDEAAKRCHATEAERKQLGTIVMEEWINDVWDVVGRIGAALAARK